MILLHESQHECLTLGCLTARSPIAVDRELPDLSIELHDRASQVASRGDLPISLTEPQGESEIDVHAREQSGGIVRERRDRAEGSARHLPEAQPLVDVPGRRGSAG